MLRTRTAHAAGEITRFEVLTHTFIHYVIYIVGFDCFN